jgi:DNA-binding NarL/FixJ family response regulator
MFTSIRVLLVDDHRLLVQSLRLVLDAQPDIKVVGSANSADEAIEKTKELCPDIAIMDIDMPGLLCFDAAHTMVALSPQTKIIYLSGFSSDHYIEAALGAYARGYITKDEPVEAILEAIRTVAAGSAYFSPSILSRIIIDDKPRLAALSSSRRSLLSPREVEIVQYLARGLSKKQIALALHLAVRTVDNHTTRVMRKLDIHDRVELTRYALKEGIASL